MKSNDDFNKANSAHKPKRAQKPKKVQKFKGTQKPTLMEQKKEKHEINWNENKKKPSCKDCSCKCMHPDGRTCENEWGPANCRFKK